MPNIDNLTILGVKTSQPTTPSKDILETFENEHESQVFLVPFVHDRDEFTSLCPVTGQPDFAKMEILYVPDKLMVESKSLKLYLGSFRNTGQFHEDICNRIADDLYEVLQPVYLRVYGDFSPRGGLAIKPMVERHSTQFHDYEEDIERLILCWEFKKR